MKVSYNITQNKFNATLNQETTEIKVSFKNGYYPLPVGLENYYTKSEIDTFNSNTFIYINQKISDYDAQIQTQFIYYYNKIEIDSLLYSRYYKKSETYSKNEVDDFLDLKADLSSLGNYYTKLETYSQTEIDNSLALKLDKGNYTGTAQDLKNSIDGKLNKPLSPNNTNQYVIMGDGSTKPAGDLGKNFFNSDLSNTTARNHTMNAGVTINTLGNPYSITGLPDKASDTTNFDKVLKYNPSTGQFAYGQAFVYNVPSTITVNHVNAPASPNVPSYVQEIQDRLTQLHQSGVTMQKFTNWNINKYVGVTDTTTRVDNNNKVITYLEPYKIASTIKLNEDVISIYTDRILPFSADWAVMFNVGIGIWGNAYNSPDTANTNRLIGLYTSGDSMITPSLYIQDGSNNYNEITLKLTATKWVSSNNGTNTSSILYANNKKAEIPVLILKTGNYILVQMQYNTGVISEIYSASNFPTDYFGLSVKVSKQISYSLNTQTGVVSNIRYYIFP